MDVVERIKIERVSYGNGEVEIYVLTNLLDPTGRVVGSRNILNIRAKEPTGNWGNAEIEAILREHQSIAQNPVPPMPAVSAVLDAKTGKELRPALAEVPAQPAIFQPTFAKSAVFTWE